MGEDRSAGGARFEWVKLPNRQGGPNHLHALGNVGHDEVGVGEQREMDRLAGRVTQWSEELACPTLQGRRLTGPPGDDDRLGAEFPLR
nr:hypothetical protein [Rhodococcus sp. BP22]